MYVFSLFLFFSKPSSSIISAVYIAGIMFYKLGLEFFNGSITSLATDRFTSARTFTKCAWGVV